MSLEQKIMSDLKAAMKSKDKAAVRGIRAIKAAILLAKTSGKDGGLDEEAEIKMLQKLIKQRKDSIEIFAKQGRDDLANIEQEEVEVLQQYLPAQLGEEELKDIIDKIIITSGAQGMKDMGKVMGMANKELAGKADGKTIASIVKNKLQNDN